MFRHLSTRNISSKSMHAFLSNLAHRQTNERGRAGENIPPPLSEVNNQWALYTTDAYLRRWTLSGTCGPAQSPPLCTKCDNPCTRQRPVYQLHIIRCSTIYLCTLSYIETGRLILSYYIDFVVRHAVRAEFPYFLLVLKALSCIYFKCVCVCVCVCVFISARARQLELYVRAVIYTLKDELICRTSCSIN